MEDFIAFTVLVAIEEPVSAHVINEVKKHAPTLVPDVVADFIRPQDLERNEKDRYELVGNRFMSKVEYEYNMDQVTLAMSDDMDWVKKFMGIYEIFKFCDGTLIDIRDQLKNMLRVNKVGKRYKYLNNREWYERDVRRYDTMLIKIEDVLKELRQMQKLESYVGGRPKTRDIRLCVRPK
ncbi:hypothetical protein Tco_0123574 [Tanacetum coccineum]